MAGDSTTTLPSRSQMRAASDQQPVLLRHNRPHDALGVPEL